MTTTTTQTVSGFEFALYEQTCARSTRRFRTEKSKLNFYTMERSAYDAAKATLETKHLKEVETAYARLMNSK